MRYFKNCDDGQDNFSIKKKIYEIKVLKSLGSNIIALQPPTLKNIHFLKCPVHADFENVPSFFPSC